MRGWQAYRQNLELLRQEFTRASAEDLQPLLRRAETLLQTLTQAAAEEDARTTGEELPGLAEKVQVVCEQLRLDSIPLPADAPSEFRQLVASFQGRLLSPRLVSEFQQALAEYAQTLRSEQERLGTLEHEVAGARQTRDVLRTYFDLLGFVEAVTPTTDT